MDMGEAIRILKEQIGKIEEAAASPVIRPGIPNLEQYDRQNTSGGIQP